MNSLLCTKAPVVGIPQEGRAPVCIDGKRLRAWAKGLTLERVEVLHSPGEWYPVEQKPHGWQAKGPVNLIAERTADSYRVRFTARGGRSACIMPAITPDGLKKWAEKERERLSKKSATPTLSREMQKALKRTEYEDDGEGMIPVLCVTGGGKVQKSGIPVEIPEWPELQFAVVKWGGDKYKPLTFTVTEMLSGVSIGSGATAKQAIVDARLTLRKQSREKLAAKALDIAMKEAERLCA